MRGLDCSAFVKKMYEIFEVQLPRCAREQFYAGPRIDKEDLLTGDLVFFKASRFPSTLPTSVSISGTGSLYHASSLLRKGVKVDRLSDSYFARTYTGAVRRLQAVRGLADAGLMDPNAQISHDKQLSKRGRSTRPRPAIRKSNSEKTRRKARKRNRH